MSHPTTLPESSFVPVTTRRLARPELLWQDDTAQAHGVDPERVFCGPTADDSVAAYTDETRGEWADRYGGIGGGAAIEKRPRLLATRHSTRLGHKTDPSAAFKVCLRQFASLIEHLKNTVALLDSQ